MTDPIARGIAALEQTPVPLEWEAVVERINEGSPLDLMPADMGRGAGRRRWLIAAAVLVILGVAGGLAANRQTQFRTLYHHVTGADPTDEGYISPYRATHLKEWLKDYDPAEIDYLKATGTFSPTLELEVVTLEFRQACRETARAESAAQAASSTDRASIVDGIMIPEIARLKDRNSARDESAKMFSDLAEKLKAGDYASVTDWLSGPSGACTDAISYGH